MFDQLNRILTAGSRHLGIGLLMLTLPCGCTLLNGGYSADGQGEVVQVVRTPVQAIQGVPLPVLGNGSFIVTDKGLVYDFKEGLHRLFQIDCEARSAAVSSGGRLLAVACPRVIKIYSMRTGKELARDERIKVRIFDIRFTPDDRSILLGGVDGKMYRWKIDQTQTENIFSEPDRSLERYVASPVPLAAVGVHPTGRVFFSANIAGDVGVWFSTDADAYKGAYDEVVRPGGMFSERVPRKVGHAAGGAYERLLVNPTGEFLLLTREGGYLDVWRTRGLVQEVAEEAHNGVILDIALSGNIIATLGRDGKIKLWKLLYAEDKAEIELQNEVESNDAERVFFQGNNLGVITRAGTVQFRNVS